MPAMRLLAARDTARLLANGRRQQPRKATAKELDLKPVVKLFLPDAPCTWLLTELDPDDADRAFGLCDLGQGAPELGYVSLKALAKLRGFIRLTVVRDRAFVADRPLSAYAADAKKAGRITV
jgi:hypothetical protein